MYRAGSAGRFHPFTGGWNSIRDWDEVITEVPRRPIMQTPIHFLSFDVLFIVVIIVDDDVMR